MQLLQQQIQLQQQHMLEQQKQMTELIVQLKAPTETSTTPLQAMSIPSFTAFDSTAEL